MNPVTFVGGRIPAWLHGESGHDHGRLPRRYGRTNPKRHVHANRSRERAMIMGVLPVGGGRTNPPTQPARPRALSSSRPPTCDQPPGQIHLPRLAPRRTPATSRRACGTLTQQPHSPGTRKRAVPHSGLPARGSRGPRPCQTTLIAIGTEPAKAHSRRRIVVLTNAYLSSWVSIFSTNATAWRRSVHNQLLRVQPTSRAKRVMFGQA